MKKWTWLLAVPYVVNTSTYCIQGMPISYTTIPPTDGDICVQVGKYFRVGSMQCSGNFEECQDWAEALNEAHVRRTEDNAKANCDQMGGSMTDHGCMTE
jgi:hypothetical protein